MLKKIREFDYDFKNDIFFFKAKNREYSHSFEMQNLVIDFNLENFIVGLQIFNASEFFGIQKYRLNKVQNFNVQSKVKDGIIQIKISFAINIRNQLI